MFATQFSSPRALARIHQAIQAGIGYRWTDGNEGGAGGGGNPPAPKADPKQNEPAKLALTQAELDAKIAAAVADTQKRIDAKAKKDADDRAAEEAKKNGEFEKLAKTASDRAEAAEAEAKGLKRSIALRDHLAEKHPEYASCAKYILPLIASDVEGEDLTKAIVTAASDYVKDNPRQPKGSTPAPPLPRTGNRAIAGVAGTNGQKHQPAYTPSAASSRF